MAESRLIKIKEISPNKGQIPNVNKNPRSIKGEKFDKLCKSITDNPEMLELRELLVYPYEGKYVCIGGNMRYEACKKLGYKEVPCKVIPTDTPAETLNAYIIKDNNPYGEWDWDALGNEWDSALLDDWGLDCWQDEDEEKGSANNADDKGVDESNVIQRCNRGDIWKCGQHRLMCGDSTSDEDVAKLMGNVKADIVLSDPPYGMHLDTDFSNCKGSLKSIGRKNNTEGNKYKPVIGDNDDFSPALIETFFKNFGYCKEVFLFGADYYAELLPNKNDGSWLCWDKRKESQAEAIGSEFELIWSKTKHKRRMLRHDWFGFLSSEDSEDARNRVHPTQKPVSLLTDILMQWGDKAKNVVDLYGGSGSTMIAAERLGKSSFLMELDPHYCDVILARWEQATGEKAVKL